MAEHDAQLVVGSRFATAGDAYDVGRMRRFVMRRLAAMASRRTGIRVTDATSGFRAIGGKLLGAFAASIPHGVSRRHDRIAGARGPGRVPRGRGAGGDASAGGRRLERVLDLVGVVLAASRHRGVAAALPTDRAARGAVHPVGGRSGVRIAITGVTGFIGRHLATRARSRVRRDRAQPSTHGPAHRTFPSTIVTSSSCPRGPTRRRSRTSTSSCISRSHPNRRRPPPSTP